MRYSRRQSRRSRPFYRSLFKKTGVLFLLFVVIKASVSLGSGEAADDFFRRLFSSGDTAAAILGSELPGSPGDDDTIKDALKSESASLTYYDDALEAALLAEEDNSENLPDPSDTPPVNEQEDEPAKQPEEESQPESDDDPASASADITDLSQVDLSQYVTAADIKNQTSYDIDPSALVSEGYDFTIDPDSPQILIVHTHGSEAYTPDGEDTYTESDPMRTEDTDQNVVRVGDELAAAFEERGIKVLHDRSLYDYPSYNGSYTRSMEAIESYLDEYPDIKIVIDLHRDAVDSSYVTTAEVDGKTCSQVLLLIGTDYSGLDHPNWRENLKFGLTLQAAMNYEYPGLARPLKVSEYRYNQNATTGSMILEVGYCTNTLQQSIDAVKYFADAASDVLLSED
jgi:stage II sporulation protein P